MRRTVDRVEEWVGSGKIPSASVCVRVDGREVLAMTVGQARLALPPLGLAARPAAADQAYDLASVTKALAAAPIVAAMVADKRLRFEDPVARYVAGFDPRAQIHHLLTHSSGALWWSPLYAQADGAWGSASTRARLLDLAAAIPLQSAPGEIHAYSDIGMLVLLRVLENVGGDRLDVLHHRWVTGPAEIDDLRFGGWPGAAATERCPVRGAVVEGTVHDLNCAALGGISTHAGLFGTARAVALLGEKLMNAVLDPEASPHLPGAALATMWDDLKGPGTHRGVWDTRSRDGYTSSGAFWPDDSRGHLGYTGTSVWTARSKRTVVALLTNRVHPDDAKEAIKAFRPLVHDAVAQDLGW